MPKSKHDLGKDGRTDLMCAIMEQDIELIETLIDSGADLEIRDKQGHNILYYAFADYFSQRKYQYYILEILYKYNILLLSLGFQCKLSN